MYIRVYNILNNTLIDVNVSLSFQEQHLYNVQRHIRVCVYIIYLKQYLSQYTGVCVYSAQTLWVTCVFK